MNWRPLRARAFHPANVFDATPRDWHPARLSLRFRLAQAFRPTAARQDISPGHASSWSDWAEDPTLPEPSTSKTFWQWLARRLGQ